MGIHRLFATWNLRGKTLASVNEWLEIEASGHDVLGLQEMGGFRELLLMMLGSCTRIHSAGSEDIHDYLVFGTASRRVQTVALLWALLWVSRVLRELGFDC